MSVDLLGPEPIYQQIADLIEKRIADGVYQPRRAIPSTAQICDEFTVSAKTARAAVAVLVERGLVETRVGKGVFVLPPDARPPADSGEQAGG
jgi:GntR family transcriptional regulator